MPEPTPRRAGREPLEGSRFLSDVLADKVRAYRLLRRLKQDDLAEGMQGLRHTTWSRQTVGDVERGRRNLTVDELAGLSLLLQVPLFKLLDPEPLEGGQPMALDVGAQVPIPPDQARDWIYGRSIVLFRTVVGANGKRRVQAVAIASAEEVAAEAERMRREVPPSRQLFGGPTPATAGGQEGGDAQ
jgi:transcriptional regulator with XRE-family HTH domain